MNLTKKWTTAAAICAAGFCSAANAAPMSWTDTVDLTPDPLLTAWTTSGYIDYTHFIEGFNTATDTVDSYSLTFQLYDDRDSRTEVWLHSVPTVFGEWEIENTGSLYVAVLAVIGDFYVGGSTLTVNGQRRNVPEPGTLAMFGAALLGFGLLRRKRETN
jgi:hypothetical protein